MAKNLTEVRLLNVPLDNKYIHTLYFDSASAQSEYFTGKQITNGKATDCTYQRDNNKIRFPAMIEDIRMCNYVMYKNAGYSDKWYYAFVTKMEYKDDGCTWIYIETDVIQTWLFDYQVGYCFVEREHVTDDTIGKHTVPEQLELGDYVINKKNKNNSLGVFGIIMGVTVDLNNFSSGKFANAGGGWYNSVYSGVKYYKFGDASEINAVLKKLADAGQSDAVVSIFMLPTLFYSSSVPSGGTYSEITTSMGAKKLDWVNTLGVNDEENYKPTNLNGYIPKNNKLFTYPYCYMLMNNSAGGSAIYKYELFNNPDDNKHCAFYIYSAMTPSGSIVISPRYYNGCDINSLECLPLGKFPVCSWNTDVYTNWLTQNAVNIGIQLGTSVLQIAGGVAGGTFGGAVGMVAGGSSIASGIQGVTSLVGEVYQHSLQPPQAEGNVNSGDVMFASGCLSFYAYQMTIKKEYAQIIDDYFQMYGYKVNRSKVPNKNHRAHWWYTKTVDADINGAIPMEDLMKIKECYDKGITFWKNAGNIGRYYLTNSIVS